MLRKIRLVLATLFFTLITLLFLDFTGTIHAWFDWMAKIQFLPAVLALNLGVVALLIILTLIFGRIYCSVICPLGVFQDIAAWVGKQNKKNRYNYSPALSWLRYGVLAVFIVAMLADFGSLAALLAPYSSYGRIANNLFAPIYQGLNNILAYFAERMDSYAFYETDIWIKSMPTFIIAIATFIIIGVLAWKNGRTYCNTICPVGTVLGFLARFSWFKPVIDTDCMDCIDKCKKGAISYTHRAATAAETQDKNIDKSRRTFLTTTAFLTASSVLKAQEKKVDGGLAVIADKKVPKRNTHIVPPGASGIRHFAQHCTACQLCVSVCPNRVLRPSSDITRLMQPEMSYEFGYCRPECAKCTEVCPTDAIHLTDLAEKFSTQIGHAVWIKDNCVPLTDGEECGNCARHCPSGAIQMVPSDAGNPASPKIPVINEERCIGCGACENLCPARPFSAIYVEGHEKHRII